jgi:hypothetical protein
MNIAATAAYKRNSRFICSFQIEPCSSWAVQLFVVGIKTFAFTEHVNQFNAVNFVLLWIFGCK